MEAACDESSVSLQLNGVKFVTCNLKDKRAEYNQITTSIQTLCQSSQSELDPDCLEKDSLLIWSGRPAVGGVGCSTTEQPADHCKYLQSVAESEKSSMQSLDNHWFILVTRRLPSDFYPPTGQGRLCFGSHWAPSLCANSEGGQGLVTFWCWSRSWSGSRFLYKEFFTERGTCSTEDPSSYTVCDSHKRWSGSYLTDEVNWSSPA